MSLQNLRPPFETGDVDFLHLRPLRSDLKNDWVMKILYFVYILAGAAEAFIRTMVL